MGQDLHNEVRVVITHLKSGVEISSSAQNKANVNPNIMLENKRNR